MSLINSYLVALLATWAIVASAEVARSRIYHSRPEFTVQQFQEHAVVATPYLLGTIQHAAPVIPKQSEVHVVDQTVGEELFAPAPLAAYQEAEQKEELPPGYVSLPRKIDTPPGYQLLPKPQPYYY